MSVTAMMPADLSRRLAGIMHTNAWNDATKAQREAMLRRFRTLQRVGDLPPRLRRIVNAALRELEAERR